MLSVVEGDQVVILRVEPAAALPGTDTCQCYAMGRVGAVKSSRLLFDERAEYPTKSESYLPLLNVSTEEKKRKERRRRREVKEGTREEEKSSRESLT